jgi:cytochrome d ubiquinol oxidase subunit II
MDLVHLWVCLVGVVIILYVVLDGFSLGVGILFPGAEDEAQRDMMMNTIAPVWDANQTWIVFGGGALFAVFPMVYTVLFPAFYIPLLTLLFGMIFRGVAFDFRAHATNKQGWNRAFFWGSTVAAFFQGVVLGAYISGVRVVDGAFAGSAFDWLHPFSIMVGLALVTGYALLGSTFLLIKTTGAVQERAFRQARMAAFMVAGFMLLVSVWTPLHDPMFPERWFSAPRVYFIWVFPVLGAVSFFLLLRSIGQRREVMPFVCTVLLFLSAYFGLQAAIYPNAILPGVTIYEAASQRETQIFTLIGVGIMLPVIVFYTLYSYWVFRGKVTAGDGYH